MLHVEAARNTNNSFQNVSVFALENGRKILKINNDEGKSLLAVRGPGSRPRKEEKMDIC